MLCYDMDDILPETLTDHVVLLRVLDVSSVPLQVAAPDQLFCSCGQQTYSNAKRWPSRYLVCLIIYKSSTVLYRPLSSSCPYTIVTVHV